MSLKVVNLTDIQSVVLGVIKKHSFVSVAEIAFRTNFTEKDINAALKLLEHHCMVMIGCGGCPKRYSPVGVNKKEKAAKKKKWTDWNDEVDCAAEEALAGDEIIPIETKPVEGV